MSRTLFVTNDFPPRQGGIEAFVRAVADRFPKGEVVVYTSHEPGDTEYDATLAYPVIRDKSRTLLPTARVRRAVVDVLKKHDCDTVVFGASAPLALLAPALRDAGAKRIVGITHSAETWWARMPLMRGVIRRAGDGVDHLTFINDWCRDIIARPMRPAARDNMRRLHPGADVARFHPDAGGEQVREKLGIAPQTPVVVCAARVVKRKGQDMLIRSWPQVLKEVPGAKLLIVGNGPARKYLDRLVQKNQVADSVIFTGPIPWDDVPPYVAAGNVFAMPSRTRLMGLEPEGLPLAFFEGAATELPVIVGRSGGAPDAIVDGETGYVVDPRDTSDIAARLVELLQQPDRAKEMGKAGRKRVAQDWTWDQIAHTCRQYLGLEPAAK